MTHPIAELQRQKQLQVVARLRAPDPVVLHVDATLQHFAISHLGQSEMVLAQQLIVRAPAVFVQASSEALARLRRFLGSFCDK
jgi:hypothetical protein